MGVITDLTNTGWDRNAVVGSKFSMQKSSHGLVGTFTKPPANTTLLKGDGPLVSYKTILGSPVGSRPFPLQIR